MVKVRFEVKRRSISSWPVFTRRLDCGVPAAFTRTSIFLSAYYKSEIRSHYGRVSDGCKTHSYRILHFVPLADHKVSMAILLYGPLFRWYRLYFG